MHNLRYGRPALALVAILMCAATAIVFASIRALASTPPCINAAFDFLDYESLPAALEHTDAVLLVSTTKIAPLAQDDNSTDSELPVEQVSAQVDRVLQGNQALLSSTITINQYSTAVCNQDADRSRLAADQQYVIFARSLNESSPLWLLPLGGQGNYLVDAQSGQLRSTDGALPELAHNNLTVDQLAALLN